MSVVLQTPRLTLRHLAEEDAPFILELLNDPLWVRFIGNKSVDSIPGAVAYVARTQRMYSEKGFGLWLVERNADRAPLGLCGLIKRDTLPDVDLGFGFLSRYHGEGYGYESAAAAVAVGRERFALPRIVGVTSPDNDASSALLRKLGFSFERDMEWTAGEPAKLFSMRLAPAGESPGKTTRVS